jgi:hypothetical protein
MTETTDVLTLKRKAEPAYRVRPAKDVERIVMIKSPLQ